MRGELYYEGGGYWLPYTVWERGEPIEWNGGGRHPLDGEFAACPTRDRAEKIVRCVNAHDELVGLLEQALYALVNEGYEDSGPAYLVTKIRSALDRARGEATP